MEAAQAFNWPITVYYEDTDAGGVVYHSNYLKYFERARTELLRNSGVSQQALLERDLGFVVRHLAIDYIKGAKLDDQLIVRTKISELRRASIEFCQDLVNNDGQILCKAVVKVACIHSSSMKPTAIPENIKSEISSDC
ncbi:tol-pal system-associated acyl-CoA thioesterase [Photobacterium sanguinicancri]|uniref:Tol-pal system-associated acyl-CoA thioesterase n=1 Tax=Photobacterium sanguinicancri TaxID=875932 RepID=A0AAW7XY38_9GAMM|nr:tol-pal system-associated acyl-CoA thioesterase [Photobacterium sanguinicancri]MDO6497372.1 tol-pal system-associated acyl-CoA thioesterase [Photobacterium sanguinicancri]MDO6541002.1 tol-pal system-associated acyl-CoA thioesterase [Photobacterium sanguinicancri]OZS43518.1 tol-pal system-associated acyl-CoA thioesterase [Photobacterium sanguinicancri]